MDRMEEMGEEERGNCASVRSIVVEEKREEGRYRR